MKTLIVSDIHLTHKFDERKYRLLKRLFSSHDHIILNGDFWDGYLTSFDRFLDSKWNSLFPLLKSKNTIYLYGNHDQKIFSDSRTSLFSNEQKDTHYLSLTDATYRVEHGHALCPAMDLKYHIPRNFMFYIMTISEKLEHILVRLRSPQNLIVRFANKNIINKLRADNVTYWYLCGHTHVASFDKKNMFANSGFIQHGKATYLIADSSGVSLHTEWYK